MFAMNRGCYIARRSHYTPMAILSQWVRLLIAEVLSSQMVVAYFEMDFKDDDKNLGRWLPNVAYSAMDETHPDIIRTAVMVATRDVEDGEELLAQYSQIH
ncbi:hypothetical protein HDU67_008950 [Dinochytrium kinnereticum]|nr:hypothetical protein HDU67_008950 [Dinochytrium kinnereticum]